MATIDANRETDEKLDAGTSAALRVNRRIQKDEIPLFMRRCIIDTTLWEVDGTRYDEWRAENGNGKVPAADWRDRVVIPHLQQRFDGLELRDDDRLYGIRNDTAEEINERFYNPQQLRGAMLAKCPGQRWLFTLGCCRRNRPPQ
jgi:hypothetical protein